MDMRVGSLFSGYGGLDMAVGGELAWYAEVEPAACRVMEAHHPGVPNLGDVTQVDWAAVEPVDVITGGYPCQPFSSAGMRRGTADERHLWPYLFSAIRTIRPKYAVLENVAGHLTLGFADVLADLASIGWDAEWGTLRAADAGAPHNRNRLFVLTYPASAERRAPQSDDLSAQRSPELGERTSAAPDSHSHGYGGGGGLTSNGSCGWWRCARNTRTATATDAASFKSCLGSLRVSNPSVGSRDK